MNLNILPVKDKKDKYYTDKGSLPNLPMKIVCVGKSHYSGKTTVALNFLCRFYENDFLGEDIFIVSKSLGLCNKIDSLIKYKDIPEKNLYKSFDETLINKQYDIIEEKYKLAISKGETPRNTIFYFDDVGFDASLKKGYGVYNKIFMNGRHINLSSFTCIQSYVDCVLNCRRNLTALIIFNISEKDLDMINDEHNYLEGGKKVFKSMFRKSIEGNKHNFFVVNYSNDWKNLYQNSKFEGINLEGNFA